MAETNFAIELFYEQKNYILYHFFFRTCSCIFLTGRKDSLYRQARLSYRIDDPNNNVVNIEDDFLHTQFLALVNKKGEVVKIYDGLRQAEIEQLIKDAERLLKEE